MYDIVIVAIFVASVFTIVPLFLLNAPYGRYSRQGWGPSISARWAWIFMELPAVVVPFVMYAALPNRGAAAIVLLALWEIHYIYRTFLYPALMRGAQKSFPMVLILMAFLFNTGNGYVNGKNLFSVNAGYGAPWFAHVRCIAGIVVFLLGLLIHIQSDRILRNLRKPGETDYRIPHGWAFRFVSAPNYLGEIVQWCGWAIATWSLAGLAFAVFTIANLFPRAIAHHRWYLANFPDYPESRKAVIPFLL